MWRIILSSFFGLALAGCASITGPSPAPSCDGYSRRPLNRSLWDWEGAKPVPPSVASPALPAAEAGTSALPPVAPLMRKGGAGAAGRPAASAEFDVAASLQACTGERRHG